MRHHCSLNLIWGMQVPFHQDARPHIFTNARTLRKEMTDAEKVLWQVLRNRRFHGLKFRRQHPIQSYIVDFYCYQIGLVIEIDGHIHTEKNHSENDIERTAQLEAQGLTVIRFTNEEVLSDISNVRIKIETHIPNTNLNKQSPLSASERGWG
jgi:very-short-patch-repair endonuclease